MISALARFFTRLDCFLNDTERLGAFEASGQLHLEFRVLVWGLGFM